MKVTVYLPDDRPDLAIFAHRALNSLLADGHRNCAYLYGEPAQAVAYGERTRAGNISIRVEARP
jgi:hypothetical protein